MKMSGEVNDDQTRSRIFIKSLIYKNLLVLLLLRRTKLLITPLSKCISRTYQEDNQA